MPLLLSLVLLCFLPKVQAATTTYWELNTFQEFLKGKFEGVSLTRDGRLILAPKTETLFTGEQPVIWSIAVTPQATYVATGHRGQVYRVAGGKSELVWTAPEPEVFALAVDGKGTLFAATSPDGKIYRIQGATATEYFNPKAKYIWSLRFAADGSMYAATGDEGRIFRVTGPGQGEIWYETGQTHVTSMAFDQQGLLIAGTEPNGIIYRVMAKDKAFVLYDAPMPEVRAIVPDTEGNLYVATLGGAFGAKAAGAAGAVSQITSGPIVSTTTTSITVTDEAARAQQGIEIKPKPEPIKPPATPPPAGGVSTAPIVDYSTGLDRSAILRIGSDNLVETLWTSKEENVYDIVRVGKDILFSTDKDARIYRLDPDRKATLLVETREGEVTRLMSLADGLMAATSHGAKLFRIGSGPGESGSFQSPVHDASAPSRWGRLTFRSEGGQNTKLTIRTRSGNSAKPDKTWSDWSAPIETTGAAVGSPNARYLQWKAELSGGQGQTPQLDSVTVAYLPQNSPPVVKAIQVTSQASAATAVKTVQQASNAAYSITVSDGGEAPSTSAGTPTQTVSRPASGLLVLTWQAEDQDNDRLSYSIYFKGEGDREWKLLKKDLGELAFAMDGDALADGRYLFRVVATDAPSNAATAARESDLVSSPALIDNTPPQLSATAVRRNGTAVEFEVDAIDQTSAVRRAEISVDAGPWTALAVEDGVADSLRERFLVRMPTIPSGEHLVVVRVFDTAGNAAAIKLLLQ